MGTSGGRRGLGGSGQLPIPCDMLRDDGMYRQDAEDGITHHQIASNAHAEGFGEFRAQDTSQYVLLARIRFYTESFAATLPFKVNFHSMK
jgi:hypothetical protein